MAATTEVGEEIVNTAKTSSSGSAISDQCALGNRLTSLDQRFSSPTPFPLLYYGEVGPDRWLSNFLDCDHNKKHILYCEPAHTQIHPPETEAKLSTYDVLSCFLFCSFVLV